MKLFQLLRRVLSARTDRNRRSRKRKDATANAAVVISDTNLESRVLLSADSTAAVADSGSPDVAAAIDFVEFSSASPTFDSFTPLVYTVTLDSQRFEAGGVSVLYGSSADFAQAGISLRSATSTGVDVVTVWQNIVIRGDESPISTPTTSFRITSAQLDDFATPRDSELPAVAESLTSFLTSSVELMTSSLVSPDSIPDASSTAAERANPVETETRSTSVSVQSQTPVPTQFHPAIAPDSPAASIAGSESLVVSKTKAESQSTRQLSPRFGSFQNLIPTGRIKYGSELTNSEFSQSDSDSLETAETTSASLREDSVTESFADFSLTDFYADNTAWLTDLLSSELDLFAPEQNSDEEEVDNQAGDEFADTAVSSEEQSERQRPKSTISRLDYGSATAEQPIVLSHSPPERPEIVGIWQRLKFDSNPRGPPRSDHIPASEFARLTRGAQQLQQLRYSIAPRGPSLASAL